MRPVARSVALSFVLVLLAACGSGSEDSKAKQAATRPAAPTSPDAYLVSAVKAPAGDAPLTARFELLQRPVAGAEFGLRVRVEASEALETLQVRFEPPEGLVFPGAAPVLHEMKVPAGAKMDRSFKLRAMRDGFYELRVSAAAEAAPGKATSAVFSIPLVVDRAAAP